MRKLARVIKNEDELLHKLRQLQSYPFTPKKNVVLVDKVCSPTPASVRH